MNRVPCECACGAMIPKRALVTVRCTAGLPWTHGTKLCVKARSFQVAPGCVKPFTAELRATERIRSTLVHLLKLPRWRRLRYLPRLWILRRAALQRRLGPKAARSQAWRTVRFALLTSRAA